MADERTLYAGDLTTDQIGKQVSITAASGAKVTDELIEVRYFAAHVIPTGGASNGEEPPRVWVCFKNVVPERNQHAFDSLGSAGFWLGHTDHVAVSN